MWISGPIQHPICHHSTYILACRASSAYVDNLSKLVKRVDRVWIRAHALGITVQMAPGDIPSVQNMGISYTQKLGISFDTYPRHERYVYKLSPLFVYKVSEPVALQKVFRGRPQVIAPTMDEQAWLGLAFANKILVVVDKLAQGDLQK